MALHSVKIVSMVSLVLSAALVTGCGAAGSETAPAPLAAVGQTNSDTPSAEPSDTPSETESQTPSQTPASPAKASVSPTATPKAVVPAPTKKAPAPKPTPKKTTVKTDQNYGTCKAAKAAGKGPYYEGKDPEYYWYQDRDHDGVVCE